MITAAALLQLLLTQVMVLCIGAARYSMLLLQLLLLLWCIADLRLKLLCMCNFIFDEIVIQERLSSDTYWQYDMKSQSEKYLPGTY